MPDLTEADRGNEALIRLTFETQATALHDGLVRLRSLVVPPGKGDLHGRFEQALGRLCDDATDMLAAAGAQDVQTLEAAAGRYYNSLDNLRKLTAEHLMLELGH